MRAVRISSLMMAAILLVSACGGEPGLDDWAGGWNDARASIPSLDTMSAPGHEEVCSTTLGDLRQWVADLSSAPNRDLEEAFLDWAEFAEAIFQECPIGTGPYAGFEASYVELDRLASEVEALIEFERSLEG